MWPTKSDHVRKTSPVLRVSTHIYGVSKEIDGKTFIFRGNLGMWPLKLIQGDVRKTSPVLRVSSHIYRVSKEIDGKTFIFRVNLGMWSLKPQSLIIGKMSPVLRVSSHIYGVSKEIDGKTVHCGVNLGNVTHQIKLSTHIQGDRQKTSPGKQSPSEGFNTHLRGFQGDRWENIHC